MARLRSYQKSRRDAIFIMFYNSPFGRVSTVENRNLQWNAPPVSAHPLLSNKTETKNIPPKNPTNVFVDLCPHQMQCIARDFLTVVKFYDEQLCMNRLNSCTLDISVYPMKRMEIMPNILFPERNPFALHKYRTGYIALL